MASRSSLKMGVLFLIIPTAVGAVNKMPHMTLGIALLLTSIMCGIVFQVHEKSHTDKLYGILPLRKSEMIAGRYICALLLMGVNVGLGTIMSLLVAWFCGVTMSGIQFSVVLAIGFAYCCFMVAVGYPLYLRFEYQKAYVGANIPMFLMFIAAVVLGTHTELLQNFSGMIRFFAERPALIPLCGAVVGLGFLCASMAVAGVIYRRKEL
jgi:ABC-type transport system involved in multi-copper enzyme maturation permease subunit